MHKEIERKFLVVSEAYQKEAVQKTNIVQAFLSKDPDRTVRVRIKEDKGWITVKGKSTTDGLSRLEWEKEIPTNEAKQLLKLCLPMPIYKTRYEIPFGIFTIEVDVFKKQHEGLVIAEIEIPEKNITLPLLPSWIGSEVTGNVSYYNSQL